MNIYYIANSKLPTIKAHGYQICKMCEEFSNLGKKVVLIYIHCKGNTENIFNYYKIKNNFKIKKVKIFNHLKYKFFLGRYAIFLQKAIFLLKCFFLKIPKGTIIYTREFEVAWLMNLRGFKTVCELHSVPEKNKNLFSYFLNDNIKYIFITKGILNEIQKYKKIKNYLIAPDGVDLKLFDISISKEDARKKLNLSNDKKIILYTGHLYEWKGVDILAKVALNLSDEFLIYLVGGAKEEQASFIGRNDKLSKNIKLVVHQKREEVSIWLKAADTLALPNSSKEKISNNYTSPLKMFEYMASGTLIVASSLPSIKEILNENNSVLFSADNNDDFLKKINIALNMDENKKNGIIKEAYTDVLKYTWEKRVKNILNFINYIDNEGEKIYE